MQYANVSKAKLKNWHKVWGPKWESLIKARDWCNAQPSPAKYFNRYKQPYWYFESEADAVLFAMLWSVDPDKQNEMNFKVIKTKVTAKSRKMKASWTLV